MIVEVKCEKPKMNVVYTYLEVEDINIISKDKYNRVIIKQKDEIPNTSDIYSDWSIHIKGE